MREIRVLALVVMLAAGYQAMAIEEPDYEVVHQADGYELRQYAPYIVAEVDVDGTFRSAGNSAFRILAGYIFGDNRRAEKMAMTAPVQSTPGGASEKMAMTVPVTSTPAAPDAERYTYAFVMEKKYTLDTLPVPNDSRVRIREVAPAVIAVRRFSGRWSDGNYGKNESALLDALENDGIRVQGEPTLARYNGPMTPWFLRRNEVMVPVDWPQ